jgi:CMP-N-acetylneuraminic acid synthetase
MRVLGIVPARGGSKAIPQKNLRVVAGRPLLAYTADAVRESRRLDRVVLSTDDPAIADAGRAVGLDAPFLRPAALAADDTPMMPVLRHAVEEMAARGFDADAVVLLQPTSPLRRGAHIDAAIDLLERSGVDTVVSVVEVPHQFTPGSLMRMEGERLRRFEEGAVVTRRQDKPRLYARNGPAVLACRTRVLDAASFYEGECRPLVMDPLESIDVDGPADLELVEFVLSRRSAAR